MEVSKLTVKKKVHGQRRLDILHFCQDELEKNPRFLTDTNLRILGSQYKNYVESRGESIASPSIQNTFIDMIAKGQLVKFNIKKRNRYSLRINYLYPGLPLEVVQKARKEDIEYISGLEKRLAEIKDGNKDKEVHLDGKTEAIITKPKKEEPEEEPEEESEVEEPEEPEEPVEEPKKEPEEPVKLDSDKIAMLAALAAMVAKPRPVAEPVEVKQDSKGISLTININLNGIK